MLSCSRTLINPKVLISDLPSSSSGKPYIFLGRLINLAPRTHHRPPPPPPPHDPDPPLPPDELEKTSRRRRDESGLSCRFPVNHHLQHDHEHRSGCYTLSRLKTKPCSTTPSIGNGNRYFHWSRTWESNGPGGGGGGHMGIDQTGTGSDSTLLGPVEYDLIVEESLESLTGYFEEILENSNLVDTDVIYESGVLTVKLGDHGTYVINKQTPNRQIWLSSPTSGPKRYDFIKNTWIYKKDGISMYQLLNREIPKVVPELKIDFESNCHFGRSK